MRVDLNCDMGESYGAYVIGNDAAVLPHVTSINVACGFHGGDPGVMQRTVHAAVAHGVAIGAHPGLPDLIGFGRREMSVTAQDVYDMTVYQIGALQAVATAGGTTLQHVKPHGALYNMAAINPPLADAIARAVRDVDRRLILLGLSGSALLSAGSALGLRTASEVFADRNYQADGTLVPRSQANALIHDADAAVAHVVGMVRAHEVTAVDGTVVPVVAHSICIHGDAPGAALFAERIRSALAAAHVSVMALAASSHA